MQGELVGDFPETDLYDGFLHGGCCLVHSLSSSANSCNSFGHSNVSKNTLSHSGKDGDSPRALSCNASVPELAEGGAKIPNVRTPNFHSLSRTLARFREDFLA